MFARCYFLQPHFLTKYLNFSTEHYFSSKLIQGPASLLPMKNFLSLVKFSHTIFAMPFALVGFFIGTTVAGGDLSWQKLLLVLLCMVFARSAAMAFNRWLDRDIDAVNPRTKVREIPAGVNQPKGCTDFCAGQLSPVHRHHLVYQSLVFLALAHSINRGAGL